MQKRPLVAVDTNYPLLLAAENDDALDALQILRERVHAAEIFVTPTVLEELVHQSESDPEPARRNLARGALGCLAQTWDFQARELSSTEEIVVRDAARLVLARGLLPAEERNDAMIIAESAVLNAILLVSNDSHLLDADHRLLGLLFRELDLPVPLIVSPREIIQKFYRR
jgi:hypothetical protein